MLRVVIGLFAVLVSWYGGVAHAVIQCYECHGEKSPASGPYDYRPIDDTFRNISSGGFQGNHRRHVSSPLTFIGCAKCHPGSDLYDSSHRDGLIKVSSNINGSNYTNNPLLAAIYKNTTSAFLQTPEPQLGTCANINCHFENTTPTWGGAYLVYPQGCGTCHGAPPGGGDFGAAGSHAKHNEYYTLTTVANQCVYCHQGHTTFGQATSVGRTLVVLPRHPTDTVPGSYNGPVNDYLPKSQSNVFGSCANFYCHTDGTLVASGASPVVTTPTWGAATLGCNGCHGNPPAYPNGTPKANSHDKHGQSCGTCHSTTTTDGSTITSRTNHVNRSYTLAPGPTVSFSYSFAQSGGTCNNISCHSNGTSVATGVLVSNTMVWGTGPFYCGACHNYPPDYPTGSPKANSHTIKEHAQYSCSKCHYTTTTDGATITNPANHANGIYDVVPNPPSLFTYTFATNGGTCSTVGCHNDAGNRQWGAVLDCNYCHDSPPQTPAHLKHFSGLPSLAAYGDTHVTEDYGTTNSTGYIFNCGNCHPRAPEFHRNGKIDVEFFDPLAPDGLKKLHPVTATYTKGSQLFIDSRGYRYTKGTCSNVYCHSTHTWTTEQDAQGNVVKTNTVPVYRTVTWEGTIAKNCTACHANPPATDVATNKDGSGNSHMWLTPLGWQEGHNNKTWFNIEPIACSYCHNDTVQVKNTWTRQHDGGWPTFTFYSAVPIANYAKHVNGRVDVAFDKVRPFVVQGYDDNNLPSGNVLAYKYFSSARYTPQTKTCANVSCHKAQTSVRWGDPYYYWKVYVNEPGPQPTCYTCHVQGELPPGVP